MNESLKTGLGIVAAAAALFAASSVAAAPPASSAGDTVHCGGINACKGKSDCKSPENACKGKNSCKGHGFISTTAADCNAKGGKVLLPFAK